MFGLVLIPLFLQVTHFTLHVVECTVKVFVLDHKLLALVHVLAPEKVLEVLLQLLQHCFDAFFDGFRLGQSRLLDLFVQLEDFHHEPCVSHLYVFLDVDPS